MTVIYQNSSISVNKPPIHVKDDSWSSSVWEADSLKIWSVKTINSWRHLESTQVTLSFLGQQLDCIYVCVKEEVCAAYSAVWMNLWFRVEPGTDDEDSQPSALTQEAVMKRSASCRPGWHEVAVHVQARSNILHKPRLKMNPTKDILVATIYEL